MTDYMESLVGSLGDEKNIKLFEANKLFIDDLMDNLEEYIETYGLKNVLKIISNDLEFLNFQLLKPFSLKDQRVFEELTDELFKYIYKQPVSIAHSINNGLGLHVEEDVKAAMEKAPEYFV